MPAKDFYELFNVLFYLNRAKSWQDAEIHRQRSLRSAVVKIFGAVFRIEEVVVETKVVKAVDQTGVRGKIEPLDQSWHWGTSLLLLRFNQPFESSMNNARFAAP